MIKRLYHLIICGCLCISLQGQTEQFFPEVNDTLYYLIDYNPLYTEDNTKGYLHDFMNLSGPCLTAVNYIHAGNALTVKKYGTTITYEEQSGEYTKKTVDGIGLYGASNRVHMDYKDKFTDIGPFDLKSLQTLMSAVEIRMAYEDLHQSEKESIGECVELVIQGKHTIRIIPKGKHDLLLPGVESLVNRLQFDETFVARSGLAIQSNGAKRRLTVEQMQKLFEPYKRKKYVYYTTDNSTRLMEMHLEEERIEKIEYSADVFKSHLPECDVDSKNVYLFPNPTLGEVRLHFENYPAGDYVLDIYNIIGKRLSSIDVSLDSGENEVFLILPDLKKGTYIYSILNMDGDRLVSRRLSIINF